MSSKLQVIALISGGKDSLFSILHCLKNGHDVVALANLFPPSADAGADGEEGEDINSFMYQTVGHSIIPLYEQALKLPLYRQPILGGAVNTDKDYHHDSRPSSSAPSKVEVDAAAAKVASASSASAAADEDATDTSGGSDETESLVPLLRRVLAAHPSANAVCTGAILSTYQRTRVESVCARLGLVPLGYLWQYPALPPYRDAALLRDMAAVAQDARIVKVASGGLDAGFLWRNVAEERVVLMLRRAAARFGGEGAVLGEGGEFETVAVDGPACVWKGGRIEVEVDDEGVLGDGGSAVVRFRRARVVEKAGGDDDGLENLRVPDLLDSEFEELGRRLLSKLNSSSQTVEQSLAAATLSNESTTTPPTQHLHPHTTLHGTTLTISNLTAPPAPSGGPLSPTAQLAAITSRLRALLSAHSATPAHIASTTLLLRSMSLFAPLNPLYGALFAGAPNPPARVTVACGPSLPAGLDVALSCTASLSPRRARRALYVQSRSYWAPANIGPYSQAVAVPARSDGGAAVEMVHVAGQIPLVPASMALATAADAPASLLGAADGDGDGDGDGFAVQAVLALQHLWRVGRAMRTRWWACGTAFVAAGADGGAERARAAREAWRGVHALLRPGGGGGSGDDDDDDDGEDVVDVWDLTYGNARARGFGGAAALGAEVDGRPRLPDFEGVRWVGEEEEEGVLAPPCIVAQVLELPRAAEVEWTAPGLTNCGGVALGRREGARTRLTVHETKVGGGLVAFYAAGLAGAEDVWELEDVLGSAEVPAEGRVYTVYMAKSLPEEWLEKARPLVVPCSRVWGPEGSEVAAAVTVRYCG